MTETPQTMRFGRNLVNWQEIRAFEKTEVAQPCSSTMTDGHQRPPPPLIPHDVLVVLVENRLQRLLMLGEQFSQIHRLS